MKNLNSKAAALSRCSLVPVAWDFTGGLRPQRGRLVDLSVRATTLAAGIDTPGLRPWSRLIT